MPEATTTEGRLELVFGRITQLSKDFLESHDDLSERVAALESRPEEPKHDKLFGALAKAQTEIQNAVMDATNPHFGSQFASLASVMNAVREPLSKNSLCLLQMPRHETTDQGVLLTLETILGHSSGQSITDFFSMYPPKQDPQGLGSCLTYMRRYAAMAMVGIAGAADDDAEGTKAEAQKISAEQADEIYNLSDELFGSDSEDLLKRMCDKIFDVAKVTDIPAAEFDVAMRKIENTKKRKDKEAKTPAEKKPEPTKPTAAKPSA